MVEAAVVGHQHVEHVFAGVPERRVPQIVGQTDGFGEVFIAAQPAGQGSAELGHLNRMGQTRAIVIAFIEDKDLCLIHQPPKRGRMYDPVAVARESGSCGRFRFGISSAA